MNELKNEVKKILYKTKVMAKFSHYVSGELFYTVEIEDNTCTPNPLMPIKHYSREDIRKTLTRYGSK